MNKELKKLLVVDDDPDILKITQFSLKNLKGLQTHFVSSGKEAIYEAKTFLPDLILLDVMMPVMDGIAVFKTLKTQQETKDIPVCFFTAKVTKEEIDSFFALGACDVILKPFDPITLSKKIQEIWEKI